jgi:DNA-binding Lrp family transcriptional regulator
MMKKEISEEVLDRVDLAILRLLQADGRLSNARIAEQLALSETPCWRRLRRLEADGYIDGYQANLNRRKLGFGVLAFVQVSFSSHGGDSSERFEEAIRATQEVLACHNITGESDYMLQIVAHDLDEYARLVDTVLRRLPGVAFIRSSLSLREVKASSHLPLNPPGT